MRKRRKKIQVNKATLLAVFVIILVLVGAVVFLEKGIPKWEAQNIPEYHVKPKEELHPPRLSANLMREDLIIKGCLFDLDIKNDNTKLQGHKFKVTSTKKLTTDQLSSAFDPLRKIGSVIIKDNNEFVEIKTDKEAWEIEFIYPKKEVAAIIPPKPVVPSLSGVRMAIIVDDMGPDMKPAKQLAAIDGDLTFSIMPMRRHSQEVADYLHAKGHEVMLHLPMQGAAGNDPGEGAIFKRMAPDQIRTILLEDINAVPHISGVNNHMGSEATQDRNIMMLVETELKKNGLFYIDSLTSGKSVGFKVAQEIGLPWNKRDVFLDNEQNDAYIMGQLEELKRKAIKNTSAIGICHPHSETIAVLQREVPKLKDEGITLERVSKLIHE
jgi:polysaccharide deacetylase 2 family uncharacterized protein YibQ